jgi:rubrerythrin
MRVPAIEQSYEGFMSRAYAIEVEAVERYTQFADQLEGHNNREVAAVFRKLAEIEGLHAKHILDAMGWPSLPVLPVPYASGDPEGPETAPFDSLHYLMQPYHALEIALRCEIRAVEYFEDIAAQSADERVRAAAAHMAAEEREHVTLMRDWMKRVPQPKAGWDEDLDPPRMSE